MELKLFKNFTPYVCEKHVQAGVRPLLAKLAEYPSRDPDAGQWGTVGFAPIVEYDEAEHNEYHMDLQGAGTLLMVQFNERILPGAVRDEMVHKRVIEIEERDGHKVNRKLYAQIREDIEHELLPKAFVRRALVPVIISEHRVFVFTSSAKRADDAIMLMFRTFGNDDVFMPILLSHRVKSNPVEVLTYLAKNDGSEYSDDDDNASFFETASDAVLKGADKQTVRIKDKDIQGGDVQDLLATDKYDVTQLGLNFFESQDESEPAASLVLNAKLVVTRMIVEGVIVSKPKDAAEAIDTFTSGSWLVAKNCQVITDLITECMGGLAVVEADPNAPAAPTIDEDDEL